MKNQSGSWFTPWLWLQNLTRILRLIELPCWLHRLCYYLVDRTQRFQLVHWRQFRDRKSHPPDYLLSHFSPLTPHRWIRNIEILRRKKTIGEEPVDNWIIITLKNSSESSSSQPFTIQPRALPHNQENFSSPTTFAKHLWTWEIFARRNSIVSTTPKETSELKSRMRNERNQLLLQQQLILMRFSFFFTMVTMVGWLAVPVENYKFFFSPRSQIEIPPLAK